MVEQQVIDVERERKALLSKYRKLLRHAKPFLKGNDAKLIKRAFNTSMDAHKDMRRKSGEPYIFHPLTVAQIAVEEIGLGTTSIISALLHDVVEDTEMEIPDIQRMFGKKVARIIDGLTKISGVYDYGSSEQAENFRKMLITLSEDVRVILIKLADRLHNMRTLDSMPRHKQLKIASETMYIYAPLAHRLGLYTIKSELEDLYLRYTNTELYYDIVRKINDTKRSRSRFIRNFTRPIEGELKRLGFNFVIKGRPKSVYSIYNKMQKQDIPFEEVYDLFAIRIILDVEPEMEKAVCWQVYSIVTDFYKPNPDRLRDWISTPKANGYESLHTTVMSNTGSWVEVQIRTRRMDEIAEKGYAAHWKYKDQADDESNLDQWINKVRDSIERHDVTAIEFVDDFRSNLFNEEVFVFTPKGELKTFPGGASALDFAFDIHTDIGKRCLGAKVNQKLVPISYRLQNGDQIEILTSSKQKPHEDWLKFVVTSKARSKIKDSLKEEKKEAAKEGKEIVLRKLKQLKVEYCQDTINQLLQSFNERSPLDFYYKVGAGIIKATEIKRFSGEKDRPPTQRALLSKSTKSPKETDKSKKVSDDTLLIGEDMDVIDYKLAKCCNPIQGDEVFGFVTVSDGIKIHRTSCPNAVELLSNHGHRIIKAKWTSQQKLSFQVGLKIIGTDRVGLINDVTKVISEQLKVNMQSINIKTESGIFDGTITLFVNDKSHLTKLIKKLESVNGVIKVNRFDAEVNHNGTELRE